MILRKPSRAVQPSGLFVRSRQKDHVALERNPRAFERQQSDELRHPERFHVHRAAPVDEAVLERAAERFDRPELLVVPVYVGVIETDDRSLTPVAAQPRPDRPAAWKRLEDLMLDAFALADVGEELRRANLGARRIGRVNLEVLDE